MIVFDASAILALLFEEPGSSMVEPWLARACVSSVNLSEVVGRLIRDGQDADRASVAVLSLAIEVVPFGPEDAIRAARLLPVSQSSGLSLADRACLALAQKRGLPVLTADRVWRDLPLPIEVVVIR